MKSGIMSEVILLKVQSYLAGLSKGEGNKIPFETLGNFSESSRQALRRQLSPDNPREFRIRMSNLGRPSCQLQAEQLGFPREPEPYSNRFRNMYGELTEALAVMVMEQAGVCIKAKQEGVQLEIADQRIEGTFDLIIAEPYEKLYDVKSASSFAFRHHYNGKTLQNIWDDGDSFGYVVQLYLYSQALKIPVGGLIVVNKENGEWAVVEPPVQDKELRLAALKTASNAVIKIISKAPFQKEFSDIEETYRKKKTGNKILGNVCSFCPYRASCWPTAHLLDQPSSKGQSPKKFWYTEVNAL
jgi:hypothetical protein